jgi:hypothetical protein
MAVRKRLDKREKLGVCMGFKGGLLLEPSPK